MPYTKPPQAGYTKLKPDEFVIKLDTLHDIAVSAVISIEAITGNPVFNVNARLINSDGSDFLDATGQPVTSQFRHTSNKTEIANLGGLNNIKKALVMAAIGEPTGGLFNDPIHQTFLEHCSIRTNLVTAGFAGNVKNLGAIL